MRPQDDLTRQFLPWHSLRRAVESNAYSAGRSPHDATLTSYAGVTADQQRKFIGEVSPRRHFDLGTQLRDVDNDARSRRYSTSELQLGGISEDPARTFPAVTTAVILI
jgi:hypothetical protein